MNVNAPAKRVAISRFQAIQPKDSRNNRVAPGGIGRNHLAGGLTALEYHALGLASANLADNLHFAERSPVRPQGVANSILRRGNGIFAQFLAILDQRHLLVLDADHHTVDVAGQWLLARSQKTNGYRRDNDSQTTEHQSTISHKIAPTIPENAPLKSIFPLHISSIVSYALIVEKSSPRISAPALDAPLTHCQIASARELMPARYPSIF